MTVNTQFGLTEAVSSSTGMNVDKPVSDYDAALVKAQDVVDSLLSSDLSEIDAVPLSEDSLALIGSVREKDDSVSS